MGEPESKKVEESRGPAPEPSDGARTPLMRALGQFFGEVWKGVTADPRGGGPGEGAAASSRRRVVEREVETEEGRVILRRTTIDEVIVPPRDPGVQDRGGEGR